jgi:hypothetical protein
MLKWLRRAALVLLTALLIAYVADSLQWRALGDPFGSVDVTVQTVVPLKNGRTEYYPASTQAFQCAHALFPHAQARPCWWLERHSQQTITVDTGSQPQYPH